MKFLVLLFTFMFVNEVSIQNHFQGLASKNQKKNYFSHRKVPRRILAVSD